MTKIQSITLLLASLILFNCGDGGQLEAFKNVNACGDKTLGQFIENNAVSYKWQDMKTEEYGEVVGFIAEFEIYKKNHNAMMGFQAKYKPSELNEGQFEFFPVAMEMGKKGDASTVVPANLAYTTLSNFCKSYKKLSPEEKFIAQSVNPALELAETIKYRVGYCSADFGTSFEGDPIGRFPEKTSDCDNVFRPDSNEKGIGVEYTKDRSAKAEYLDGVVQVTFLQGQLKDKTILFESTDKTPGQLKWKCSGGTLEKNYLPVECK